MELRNIEAVVHGRFLYEHRTSDLLLVGFHGYGENAEVHFEELQRIPGVEGWSVAAVQALHPFYAGRSAGGKVVASWMTREDRELAIADNIRYVQRVVRSLPKVRRLVFAGFSQGVAMAYRAAAFGEVADGLIVLGGDVPPDVAPVVSKLPPILLGRGTQEDRYTQEKFEEDLRTLAKAHVTPCVYEGGHEWTDEFRSAAGELLKRVASKPI